MQKTETSITPRYTYPPHQRVSVDLGFIGREGATTGYIKGIASHIPGLSTVWIVELESLLENHPYSCVTVPETALIAIEELLYTNTSLNIRERVLDFLSHQNDPVSLSQLHEAMPDLLPGSLDACCHQMGSAGTISKVSYPRPNGGYITYFSRFFNP